MNDHGDRSVDHQSAEVIVRIPMQAKKGRESESRNDMILALVMTNDGW